MHARRGKGATRSWCRWKKRSSLAVIVVTSLGTRVTLALLLRFLTLFSVSSTALALALLTHSPLPLLALPGSSSGAADCRSATNRRLRVNWQSTVRGALEISHVVSDCSSLSVATAIESLLLQLVCPQTLSLRPSDVGKTAVVVGVFANLSLPRRYFSNTSLDRSEYKCGSLIRMIRGESLLRWQQREF